MFELPTANGDGYGETRRPSEYDPPSFGIWNPGIKYHYCVKIGFHQIYLKYLRETPIRNKRASEWSRFYFVMAQILLHELAQTKLLETSGSGSAEGPGHFILAGL